LRRGDRGRCGLHRGGGAGHRRPLSHDESPLGAGREGSRPRAPLFPGQAPERPRGDGVRDAPPARDRSRHPERGLGGARAGERRGDRGRHRPRTGVPLLGRRDSSAARERRRARGLRAADRSGAGAPPLSPRRARRARERRASHLRTRHSPRLLLSPRHRPRARARLARRRARRRRPERRHLALRGSAGGDDLLRHARALLGALRRRGRQHGAPGAHLRGRLRRRRHRPEEPRRLSNGSFLRGFTDKGQFSALLRSLPVRVSLDPETALLGSAQYARRLARASRG
jgi:hypothetical protein